MIQTVHVQKSVENQRMIKDIFIFMYIHMYNVIRIKVLKNFTGKDERNDKFILSALKNDTGHLRCLRCMKRNTVI